MSDTHLIAIAAGLYVKFRPTRVQMVQMIEGRRANREEAITITNLIFGAHESDLQALAKEAEVHG